jgi:Protein of unknown function (DUF2917)
MTILQHSVFYPLLGDGALQACGVRLLRTRRPGRLVVKAGRAWITRQGDLDDHVLAAGEAVDLRADEQVVVEPWEGGTQVRLAWCGVQRRAAFLRGLDGLRARALRAVAGAASAVGERLLALARSAAASAKRAQGAMPCGESSASSGALQ